MPKFDRRGARGGSAFETSKVWAGEPRSHETGLTRRRGLTIVKDGQSYLWSSTSAGEA